jgi:hypothetical protein
MTRSMRDWLTARSVVSVGYLTSRSRTPAWCSRSPTARSRAGAMLVSASRRRRYGSGTAGKCRNRLGRRRTWVHSP